MAEAMLALSWVAAAIVAILLFSEGMRRLPPWAALAAFVAIPVCATPLWLHSAAPIFSIVKVYSVCVGAIWVQLLKLGSNAERPAMRGAAYAILALNILEAVVSGASKGQWIGAAAGLLLVVTQAFPKAISVARQGARLDVRYDLGGDWVAAYTVWNFAFVHGATPPFAAFALAHLGGPLLAMRGRADRWIEARTLGLALLMIVRVSAPQPPWLALVPSWEAPQVALGIAVASLALGAWVVVRILRSRGTERPRASLLLLALRPRTGAPRHRRPLLAALTAGLCYGSWAAFANRAHGLPVALKAAATQATISITATLTLLLILERLFRWPASRVHGFWLSATATSALAATALAGGHTLAGTPNVALTIAPSACVGTVLYFLYARLLLRQASAQGEG